MGFKFPYGNKQQLNLDWFLRKFKELVAAWNDKEESIDGALDAEIQKAEDALDDVFTARDVTVAAKNDTLVAKADALTAAANAAQYWQNAAASANSAATSAVTALQAAQDAADDAVQVAADKATVAADKATVAADKATVAADKATVAADKAIVAQDKADTDDIKDAANAAALRAEGYADGTQNGAPVGSTSPYFENNAKYYSEGTAMALRSIPYFGDFSYSDDGTVITNSSQQQLVFSKNKVTLTRLGNSSTYYLVSLFGNHARTSGSPLTFDENSLVPLYVEDADTEMDVLIYMKTTNHTSSEDTPLTLFVATYDAATQTWENASLNLFNVNQLNRTRIFSIRDRLPNAFVNKNIYVGLRVRRGATAVFEYSIVYSKRYVEPVTP